ncbi:TerB family tellurite resistance protein [Sphingobacterium sp.]|uniref:TerB family tellurite resistance protein n=1 Tax=Sphingobacterium sp. TaxID=341027 RepID=UPI0028A8815B|nr:TerB family tellurite resistance protein [Sphingobacterium sp.]
MKIFKLLLLTSLCLAMPGQRLLGQSAEVSQLLLNVEKLTQMKKILSQMKQSYQILSTGYGVVRDLSKGNFDLHRVFLQGLMEASPLVRRYHKVEKVIGLQVQLVSLCKSSLQRFRNSGSFSVEELRYLSSVQQKVLKESLVNLQELTVLVLDGQVQMNDGERLLAIDDIHLRMEGNVGFLRGFLGSADMLRKQRAQQKSGLGHLERFYRRESADPS